MKTLNLSTASIHSWLQGPKPSTKKTQLLLKNVAKRLYLPLCPFHIQVLTSPPRTLASKKIVKDPNIQIVIIQETTLRDKEQLIYTNHFYFKKGKLISINHLHCSQGFYYTKLNSEL